MPHKRFLIAANWKMNASPAGFDASDAPYRPRKDMDVVAFPALPDIPDCTKAGLTVGAQCGRPEPLGAFTGDVSMEMLRKTGCTFVLCGHSERRSFHGETDADVAAQAKAALDAGLTPVVCIGETDAERNAAQEKDIIRRQLSALPKGITVFAYEPVWAIGTGKTATPEQAQEMHAFIRSILPAALQKVRIIYGGSMNAANAKDLLSQPDVDGGLIGGASLKPQEFAAIIAAAASL